MAKVVIVTGGSSGIGEAIVHLLLRQKMRVVIADVSAPARGFRTDPSKLLFVKTDVSSESSVKKMIGKTVDHFGHIDALVNNAGIMPDGDCSVEKLNLEKWNRFIGVNLTGAFLTSKYALSYLRKRKGSIINIASTRFMQSEGDDAPYAASKGGIVSLTHALAIEFGPEVRVNTISPGWIDTGKWKLEKKDHLQHPVGRVGKPEDIAHLVAFLLSKEAAFITGQNFISDGGMTTKMIYN